MQSTATELFKDSQSHIYNWTFQWIKQFGLDNQGSHFVNSILLLLLVVLFLIIIDYFTKRTLLLLTIKAIRRSTNRFDDLLIRNKTLKLVAHFVPILVAQYIMPIIFMGFPTWKENSNKILDIATTVVSLLIIHSLLKSLRDMLRMKKSFADKPLESYLQVCQIILLFIGGTICFSILTGKSPWSFLLSLGAASAILMLVFKDTILGFVASIQVSANDSIRVGDWIEMPKYGADGTVKEINLNNVKVQNFDKTITTIPTHTLLSDSFKNYRGMQQSGGRRLKRAINIKISTIRFLENEEIEKLKNIQILRPYIEERAKTIDQFNTQQQIDQSSPINGRKMTNLGMFRAYTLTYLRQNPNIHKTMPLMVRQLASTEHGVPVELYFFVNDIRWEYYEGIVSDVFDHLFAATKYFDLEIFENPASDDFRRAIRHKSLHDFADQQQ
ncbi:MULTISPECIES: mechanosensitive ion channel family protein [Sphingobacterium]|jgi:miniconductance mechanosensitive channel|uniref:mechanosensitive ion channel family protein n=1 Tax=Sphingobacterium TaxID=28453 RepID=UPI002580CCF9|nr:MULTISPECIES: mechanosensitive ion channel domain-containing protein [Sphingobacterium]MDF2852392.1 mechanosensitive ion channel protein MscS [Sphingobacterium multivorum]